MILTDDTVSKIRATIPRYPDKRSCILPALTYAYWQVGHLNDDVYCELAEILELKAVDIASAASFYTMFPKLPVGKYYIQVCHNIACALLGAESLVQYLLKKLDVEIGETTEDGLFTVVEVECLGSCTTAPMMQINNDFHENLTREKVDQILDDLRKQG